MSLSIVHWSLWGCWPSHYLIPTYNDLRTSGTTDHLTLLELFHPEMGAAQSPPNLTLMEENAWHHSTPYATQPTLDKCQKLIDSQLWISGNCSSQSKGNVRFMQRLIVLWFEHLINWFMMSITQYVQANGFASDITMPISVLPNLTSLINLK